MIDITQIKRKAAASIIFNENSQILLLMRNDIPMWEIIGGLVDEGETHMDALLREGLEELGVEVEPFRFLGTIYRQIDAHDPPNYLHFEFHESRIYSHDFILEDQIAYEWFDLNSLPKNIAPLHQYAISQALQKNDPIKQIFGLEFPEGKKYAETLSLKDFYGLEMWKNHPKVIAKREKGEMKFDPVLESKGAM